VWCGAAWTRTCGIKRAAAGFQTDRRLRIRRGLCLETGEPESILRHSARASFGANDVSDVSSFLDRCTDFSARDLENSPKRWSMMLTSDLKESGCGSRKCDSTSIVANAFAGPRRAGELRRANEAARAAVV